jgi:hypothetical protein
MRGPREAECTRAGAVDRLGYVDVIAATGDIASARAA